MPDARACAPADTARRSHPKRSREYLILSTPHYFSTFDPKGTWSPHRDGRLPTSPGSAPPSPRPWRRCRRPQGSPRLQAAPVQAARPRRSQPPAQASRSTPVTARSASTPGPAAGSTRAPTTAWWPTLSPRSPHFGMCEIILPVCNQHRTRPDACLKYV